MTTFLEQQAVRAVCGTTNTMLVIGSTTTFGSLDLDLRPAELYRSSMFA